MYSESDLQAAIEAGAISVESADALRAHVARLRASPVVDEEHFRLLTGFNDIFVTIAATILIVAVGWLGNTVRLGAADHAPSIAAGLFIAGASWDWRNISRGKDAWRCPASCCSSALRAAWRLR